MRYFTPFSILFSFLLFFSRGQEIDLQTQKIIDDRSEDISKSLATYPKWIEDFSRDSTDQQIMKFADALQFLKASRRFPDLIPKIDLYYPQIQSLLISTPGHAEAFERNYLEAKNRPSATWQDVNGVIDFRVLTHLPSPETMRVLGRMLDETKGATKEDPFPYQSKESFQMPSSAAEWAVVTLHEIGIEDPPDANAPYIDMWLMGDTMSFHPLWHTWWQEVKDGKRTYKFKDSDVIYDYDGPVKTFKKEESSGQTWNSKPVQADRNVKRDMTITKNEPVPESRGPVIWTIAAVVALLIGMWRLWTAKQKSHR